MVEYRLVSYFCCRLRHLNPRHTPRRRDGGLQELWSGSWTGKGFAYLSTFDAYHGSGEQNGLQFAGPRIVRGIALAARASIQIPQLVANQDDMGFRVTKNFQPQPLPNLGHSKHIDADVRPTKFMLQNREKAV